MFQKPVRSLDRSLVFCNRFFTSLMTLIGGTSVLLGITISFVLVYKLYEKMNENTSTLVSLSLSTAVFLPLYLIIGTLSLFPVLIFEAIASPTKMQVRRVLKYASKIEKQASDGSFATAVSFDATAAFSLRRMVEKSAYKDEFAPALSQRWLVHLADITEKFTNIRLPFLDKKEYVPESFEFLRNNLKSYRPPSPWMADPLSHEKGPDGIDTSNKQDVLFTLNVPHIVERLPLGSLTPSQFALRMILRNSGKALVYSPDIRCYVTPAWFYDLLVQDKASLESRWQTTDPISPCRSFKDPLAVQDYFLSIWHPPQDFNKALSAASRLVDISSQKS